MSLKQLKVLKNRNVDDSEFGVQVYEQTKPLGTMYKPNGNIFPMSKKDIINDIISGNDIYKTISDNSFTNVRVDGKINEGYGRYLRSVSDNTKKDNILSLPIR